MTEGNNDPTLPEGSTGDELEDIVTDFIFRREQGEPVTLEEYQDRHPKYAEDLAYLLADDSGPRALLKTADDPAAKDNATRDGYRKVGPFQILEKIAVGGGGTVYRARQEATGQLVALKVLDDIILRTPAEKDRFLREAEILRRMDVVGVVPVLDAGESEGRLYLATRWIEGRTLADLVARIASGDTEKLPDSLVSHPDQARLIARLARTFQALHEQGIIHRDIKPGNILVDRLGEPLVIDFGIASQQEGIDLTMTGEGPLGTPRYLAPELLVKGNRAVAEPTDVYGLGLCLYELTTGTRAFIQSTREDLFRQIVRTGPLMPRRLNAEISPELEACILRATATDPRHRYATMGSFARDLELVARGEAPEVATLRHAAPVRRFLRRRPWVLYAAAVLLIAAVVGGSMLKERVAREDRIQKGQALLTPTFLVPEELLPEVGDEEDDAFEVLTKEEHDDPLLPARGAWLAYARGDFHQALARLGPEADGEPPTVVLLRDWLRFVLDPVDLEDDVGDSRVQAGGTTLDIIDVRGFSGDWSKDAERRRLQRTMPSLGLFERKFLKRLEDDADSPEEALLRANILLDVLPSDLKAKEDAAPWLVRIRKEAEAARGSLERGLRHSANWIEALALVRYGDARSAIPLLGRLRDGPAPGRVNYLLGIAYLLAGERDQATTALEAASKAWIPEPEGPHLSSWATAFDQQACRKMLGWWGFAALLGEDPDGADAAAEAWMTALPYKEEDGFWHDAVFPRLIQALASGLRRDSQRAITLLDQGAAIREGLALPLIIKAKILARQGQKEEAQQVLQAAAARPQREPSSLQSYLQSGWFGLRPFSSITLFSEHTPAPKK